MADDLWTCGACGFSENDSDELTCVMCGETRGTPSLVHDEGEPVQEKTTQLHLWTCGSCTFTDNHPEDEACALCNEPRGSGNGDKAVNTDEKKNAALWICSSCGFAENSPDEVNCIMCDAAQAIDSENAPMHVNVPTQSDSALLEDEIDGLWTCTFCTFDENDAEFLSCTMCNMPRDTSALAKCPMCFTAIKIEEEKELRCPVCDHLLSDTPDDEDAMVNKSEDDKFTEGPLRDTKIFSFDESTSNCERVEVACPICTALNLVDSTKIHNIECTVCSNFFARNQAEDMDVRRKSTHSRTNNRHSRSESRGSKADVRKRYATLTSLQNSFVYDCPVCLAVMQVPRKNRNDFSCVVCNTKAVIRERSVTTSVPHQRHVHKRADWKSLLYSLKEQQTILYSPFKRELSLERQVPKECDCISHLAHHGKTHLRQKTASTRRRTASIVHSLTKSRTRGRRMPR